MHARDIGSAPHFEICFANFISKCSTPPMRVMLGVIWRNRVRSILIIVFCFLQGCSVSQENLSEDLEAYMCASISECVNSMQKRVRSYADEICEIKPEGLKAEVIVTLESDSYLKTIALDSSSGDDEFDSGSIEAVRKSAPFLEMQNLSDQDRSMVKKIRFVFHGRSKE